MKTHGRVPTASESLPYGVSEWPSHLQEKGADLFPIHKVENLTSVRKPPSETSGEHPTEIIREEFRRQDSH
eukprot:9012358-Pyramimonas_sp.AAC.1